MSSYFNYILLVAVIENSDLSTQNYIKTATHEIGHALGWRGHPVNNNTTLSWVMREGVLTNTTLQLNEKRHLGQIYPTSPYYSN